MNICRKYLTNIYKHDIIQLKSKVDLCIYGKTRPLSFKMWYNRDNVPSMQMRKGNDYEGKYQKKIRTVCID